MLNLSPLFKEFREAGAFHTLVAIETALDEHILATKAGDLAVFLALRGFDPECLNAHEIDRVIRRFESALRMLDERFRLYQYLLKRDRPELPGEELADPIVREASEDRRRYLGGKKSLCSLEAFLVVVYEGWRPTQVSKSSGASPEKLWRQLRTAFSASATRASVVDELREVQEIVLSKVNAFAVQLREIMDVEILNKDEAFQLQQRLVNGGSAKSEIRRLASNHFLDYQACDAALECHREYLRVDDDYVAVLTCKEPPAQTHALMLSPLADLEGRFIVASEWKPWNPEKIRRLVQSKRRHFHNSKTSLAAQLPSQSSGPADVLVDDAAVALIGNLGKCLEEIDVHGRQFGEFSLTIVLSENDPAALRRVVAHAFKAFAAHDARLTEERYNRLNAFLAVQPGNARFNLRRLWLSSTNYADLSLIVSPDAGSRRNPHLGREYLAILETRGGSPYFLNLHVQDVAHTFILGSTGSGKSFLLNFLLTHMRKYAPLVRIFDLGGGYESLTQLCGGAYCRINAHERPLRINPFCLAPTPENLRFLFAWVRVLIESGGYSLRAEEEQDLYEQIENLYHVSAEQRRLGTLANIVSRELRRQLQRWVQGGVYGSFFDHAHDTFTLSRFQAFDLEGMDQCKEALEPLLFYVLHRSNAAMAEEPDSFKVFVMDEAWRFFVHPVIRSYMVEALKTWRKKNACLILATQSADDLTTSAMLPVVMESCPTQLFLANPRMDRTTYQQALHLTDREIDVIASLTPKREFLIKRPDQSKVLRLDVDRKEYWIYSHHSSDAQRKRDAFARFGFSQGLAELVKENP